MKLTKIAVAGLAFIGATLSFAPASFAQGDAKVGARLFRGVCYTCHEVVEGKNKIGPSLYNIVGRKAGSVEGFKYSPAMAKSEVIWTPENIDAYITNPRAFMPGNKMAYAGLRAAKARANVIAYLIENSPGYTPGEAAPEGGQ